MNSLDLERQLRAYYAAADELAGEVPTELRDSVWSIPDDTRTTTAKVPANRLVLMAAMLLLTMIIAGMVAIGSGLVRVPELSRDDFSREAAPWVEQDMTDLPAGTYFIDVPPRGTSALVRTVRVEFTLPSGWERVAVPHLLWGNASWIGVVVVDNVYVDPCAPLSGLRDPPVGQSVAELAVALEAIPGWRFLSARDVTLDGFVGRRVELMAPADQSDCGDGSRLFHTLDDPGFIPAMRESERTTVWIIDVEGTRIVIKGGTDADASTADREALESVVESMRFEVSGPS